MERYHLYWTPCAMHYIDLMFEDIGKKEQVASDQTSKNDHKLHLQSQLFASKNA